MARAALISSTVTLESPMRRIFPSAWRAASSPTCSASGTCGSNAMELEERDLSQAQSPEAHLALLAQVLGPPDRIPAARPGAHQPGLGGDDQLAGIGAEGGPDQLLADVGTVEVGGVDQVDAQLDGSPEHPDALVPVGRLPPDPRAGESHRAEPEPVHHQLAPEGEGAARGCRSVDGRVRHLHLPVFVAPHPPGQNQCCHSHRPAPSRPRPSRRFRWPDPPRRLE